uniref:Uncharacterized protein n=1 Tax=Opuntia streptacantha TaxID=393608 RepID=A0A7C9ANZ3_OPUST
MSKTPPKGSGSGAQNDKRALSIGDSCLTSLPPTLPLTGLTSMTVKLLVSLMEGSGLMPAGSSRKSAWICRCVTEPIGWSNLKQSSGVESGLNSGLKCISGTCVVHEY